MSFYRQGPNRPTGPGVRLGVPGLTPYVKIIMIVCGAVWLIQVLLYSMGQLELSRWLGLVPTGVAAGRLWQLVTYMFLHDPRGLLHLLFNMLMLWMFGGELERYWGSRAFMRYYLVCGIGAGIITFLFNYLVIFKYFDQAIYGQVPVIGASGAVFGLFMAYGMIFSERTVLFMMLFPMKARTMALIMFAITFFYTVTQSGSGISHISHLGGAIVGFLYLKRAWRVGAFYREMRWKIMRKKFKVMPPDDKNDFDRWVN
jgi:membrane associated rhomboid family serine protease